MRGVSEKEVKKSKKERGEARGVSSQDKKGSIRSVRGTFKVSLEKGKQKPRRRDRKMKGVNKKTKGRKEGQPERGALERVGRKQILARE